MDADLLEWLELFLACVGILSFISAALYAGSKFVASCYRNWQSLEYLHAQLGHNAVNTLIETLQDIEATYGELEVRRRIIERHLKIGIYVCNPLGETTWVNDVLAEAFDLDSTEMKVHGWLSVVQDSQERHKVYEEWRTAIKEQLPYRVEYLVTPQHGAPWKAVTEAWPVRNKAGKLVCFVGYVIPKQEV